MSIGFDVLKETNGLIEYQNKKHTFNWLNTLHYFAIQTGMLI